MPRYVVISTDYKNNEEFVSFVIEADADSAVEAVKRVRDYTQHSFTVDQDELRTWLEALDGDISDYDFLEGWRDTIDNGW